ncbi:hypothetical protein EYZ11_005049 [Aspergillus tanneri]|uniref:non-specific serine/threonine protein kinase n=1 Tax=Aspergillus tanneri TaxID=1220188 RepID=A0A4S3JJI6_9EURO|nr:hypothetical protein EYZ11_005049 [Aspergillus tanneri]
MSNLHTAPDGDLELQRPGEDRTRTDSDNASAAQILEAGQEDPREDEDIDDSVKEDMKKLEDTFPGITDRFRLVNRIGEGTFSTVYKAEDLLYDHYRNDWDMFQDNQNDIWTSPPSKRRRMENESGRSLSIKRRNPRYVALKKIYVTSSPLRIQNELELLHDLHQVVAVLPFFPHTDFRIQYRTFMVADMRHYFRSLFTALHSVHKHNILHRDIKPTNFLYNPELREGVLVDFGLAEREGAEYNGTCLCANPGYVRRSRLLQNMWSAGVILLTLLGRRFPFFNSADDVDAMIEMASIFGTRRMKTAAVMHGQIFETNIPTIGEKGYSWEKLVKWASCVEELTESEKQATLLLAGLMELDPYKRMSARDALQHDFFTNPIDHDVEWGGQPEDSADTGEDDEGDREDEEADEVAMV